MKARYLRVIKDIQDSIPEDLIFRLMTKELQSPTLKKLVELALTKPDSEVSPKQKERMQAVLDSGYLDKEVEVVDRDIEKQISDYYAAEIDKAVKLGRLPKKAPTLKLLHNKGKKYARKKQKQLQALFGREEDSEGTAREDSTANEGEHNARSNDGELLPEPGRPRAE